MCIKDFNPSRPLTSDPDLAVIIELALVNHPRSCSLPRGQIDCPYHQNHKSLELQTFMSFWQFSTHDQRLTTFTWVLLSNKSVSPLACLRLKVN